MSEVLLVDVRTLNIRVSDVEVAVNTANATQSAVKFLFEEESPDDAVRIEDFAKPNGGYDFDTWLPLAYTAPRAGGRWLLLVTSLPYTDETSGADDDGIYFCASDAKYRTGIVSTHLWWELQKRKKRPRETHKFLLHMLGEFILAGVLDLDYHAETRGCMLDYCDNIADIYNAIHSESQLCPDCGRSLESRIRNGSVQLGQIAAARRLFNRAHDWRTCFVAMPFSSRFNRVNDAIHDSLEDHGWQVLRADEAIRPRLITDRIRLEIMTADLVIADVTRNNPNVLYEIGYAHALGKDVILISQDQPATLPFDVAAHETIHYQFDTAGWRELEAALVRAIGRGSW